MIAGRTRRRPAGAAVPAAGGAPQQGALPGFSIMPFDHAARFPLTGIPGNIVQDVVNVGPDGVFVATAIGYGFEPERSAGEIGVRFAPFGNTGLVFPGEIKLGELPVDALIAGFRVNPAFDHLVFPPKPDASGGPQPPADFAGAPAAPNQPAQGVPTDFSGSLFQKLRGPANVSFLFSFVDTGTGREMQDVPVHNLASLGSPNGERPFRQLARPVAFLPRSNLRLQVIERNAQCVGTLFIVLFGYKMLGTGELTEAQARELAARALRASRGPAPQGPVVPFDYVTTFELTGRAGNELSDQIAVNVEGGYMATAIGYGIALPDSGVELRGVDARQGAPPVNLSTVALRSFPPDVLRDGIRIKPPLARVAFSGPSALNTALPAELAGEIFERMNRLEDVSFRYAIYDSARGRDFQNEPINNIAGLGTADGSRPFRTLIQPLRAMPRSTLKVKVEERSGRGRLYIVFHGYKVLGGR